MKLVANPFRPGAGHPPPYLAGRGQEKREFLQLLTQEVILSNAVLTGLRGVGKTVLLDTFKPLAMDTGWLWASTDLSESASLSESNLSTRIMADLAPLVSHIVEESKRRLAKPFSGSHANQILVKLAENGLVYKNRFGRYSFAVPLFGAFIRRQGFPILGGLRNEERLRQRE